MPKKSARNVKGEQSPHVRKRVEEIHQQMREDPNPAPHEPSPLQRRMQGEGDIAAQHGHGVTRATSDKILGNLSRSRFKIPKGLKNKK